jgi:50S ribosomal protein L16 3-hydroxylase
MARGPFGRRALPPLNRPNWSLLVQGVDLHDDRIRALLDRFRFVPDARLDDVMISYATTGGGVGPHVDSYDVFLLQAHGTRRWRIGRQKDLSLVEGAPLKVLRRFEPEQSFDLEPGDMLYLPPRYAHDGVAVGECMTYSIGFRAPTLAELRRELLQRMADAGDRAQSTRHYQDKGQAATAKPAEVPSELLQFSELAVGIPSAKSAQSSSEIQLALGEYLTEPKANVWFVPPAQPRRSLTAGRLQLDRRTRMMYAGAQLFVNGESFTVAGRDAAILRELADSRIIEATSVSRLSGAAKGALLDWFNAGWMHG